MDSTEKFGENATVTKHGFKLRLLSEDPGLATGRRCGARSAVQARRERPNQVAQDRRLAEDLYYEA
jgi:hypothetical protein